MELRVYQADDPSVLIAAVDQAFAVEWTDEIDDVGAGQFTVPHDSPAVQANPTLLDGDNLVRVRVGGTDVFAWLVERKMRTRGDVWDPIQVAGPGVAKMLDDAAIYPEGGFPDRDVDGDVGVSDERIFGFQSAGYDQDKPGRDWIEATYLGTQSDPDINGWDPYPEEWPDPDAVWLAPRARDGDGSHPVGDWYVRRVVNYTAQAQYARLFATADDELMLWWNGDLMISTEGRHQWQRTFSADVWLEPDTTYVLAARVHNVAPARAGNPSAFLLTLWGLDGFGNPDHMILRSNDFGVWDVLDFPDDPPGMTPGEILVVAHDEATDRGSIPHVTVGFDGVDDSDGQPWADEIELVVSVADDSLLTVTRALGDIGVETDLSPGLVLDAWQRRGSDLTGTVSVGLDEAREVEEEYEDAKTTVVAARSADVWLLADPDPADRREKFLSLALTPSPAATALIAERVRQTFSEGRAWSLFTLHEALGPEVHVDYGMGDTILAPGLASVTAAGWSLLAGRVVMLGGRLTATGEIEWLHEVEPDA